LGYHVIRTKLLSAAFVIEYWRVISLIQLPWQKIKHDLAASVIGIKQWKYKSAGNFYSLTGANYCFSCNSSLTFRDQNDELYLNERSFIDCWIRESRKYNASNNWSNLLINRSFIYMLVVTKTALQYTVVVPLTT